MLGVYSVIGSTLSRPDNDDGVGPSIDGESILNGESGLFLDSESEPFTDGGSGPLKRVSQGLALMVSQSPSLLVNQSLSLMPNQCHSWSVGVCNRCCVVAFLTWVKNVLRAPAGDRVTL